MATYTQEISVSSNDGYEISNSSSWTDGVTQLIFGNDGAGNHFNTGMRFTNVNIPPRSKILTASIDLYIIANQNGTHTQKGIAQDNFAGYDVNNRPSQLTATTNTVNWTLPAGTGTKTLTDITAIIQEIVNRPGWVSNNAMGIMLIGSFAGNSDSQASSVEDTNPAPILTVTYVPLSSVVMLQSDIY